MEEKRLDALFARYVEHFVVFGERLGIEELSGGNPEMAAGLRERMEAFLQIQDALERRSQPLTGRTLLHYRVHEKLGTGGMGEVYRAHDLDLDREVAVKILPPILTLDPGRRKRFEREARIMAALNHRNITAIHGIEEVDGVDFLVLELVPGETLAHVIERGPLDLEKTLPLFRQIAEALEAAHEKGVVHRDLKPANIMITPDGQAKVLDFGLGKTLGVQAPRKLSESLASSLEGTVTGLILGTAAYMSPEQARGHEVDRRTDVWSFGCVLYEALTGKKAFPGTNFSETVAAILDREPDWEALPVQIPASIRRLLRRCLAKDAHRRLHDLADARIEIEDVLQPPPAVGRARRKWKLRAAAALAGALGLAIAGWLWMGTKRVGPTDREPSASKERVTGAERAESLEAYRASLREANVRWQQAFQRKHGRPAASIPYLVYVTTRRPPTLKVIDGTAYKVLATVAVENPENTDMIRSAAVSSNGAYVYAVDTHQDGVFVIDASARSRIRTAEGIFSIPVRKDPFWIAISLDSRRAYVTSTDGYVSVIDTDPSSGTFHRVLSVPEGGAIVVGRDPRGLAFTPDGTRLYVANGLSDSVSVIDTDPLSPTYDTVLPVPDGTSIRVGTEPWGVTLAPDGKRAYVTNTFSNTVSVIDTDPASASLHMVAATIPVRVFPTGVTSTPDGTRVYVVLRDNHSVAVIDTASLQALPVQIAVRETPIAIVVSPDGTRAYVTNQSSQDVSVIDTDPLSSTFHTAVATIAVDGFPLMAAIGPPPPTEN
ncbi:MAG: serine/threonine-protein kinase [Vicinamibacteria bacterium]